MLPVNDLGGAEEIEKMKGIYPLYSSPRQKNLKEPSEGKLLEGPALVKKYEGSPAKKLKGILQENKLEVPPPSPPPRKTFRRPFSWGRKLFRIFLCQ